MKSLLTFILVVLICSNEIFGATIVDKLAANQNVKTFYELFKGEYGNYNSKYLTVFAPIDGSYDTSKITDKKAFVNMHVFNWIKSPGLIANWDNIEKINAVGKLSSVSSNPALFYKMNGKSFINNGLIDEKSEMTEKEEVAYVIDQPLTLGNNMKTIEIMKGMPQISKTYELFQELLKKNVITDSDINIVPVTCILPLDTAWANVDSAEMELIKANATKLKEVMSNFYIQSSSNPWFIRNEPFTFDYGFESPFNKGAYKNDAKEFVVNGYSGKVVASNFPVSNGVFHTIDHPLISFETVQKKLTKDYPKLSALLSTMNLDITKLFTPGSKQSLVVPPDAIVQEIENLPTQKEKEEAINTLIMEGFVSSSTPGTFPNKANGKYVMRTDNADKYLDLYRSNSSYAVAVFKVTQAAELNDGMIVGVEGKVSFSNNGVVACADLYPFLKRQKVAEYYSNLKIDLDRGSPYTCLLPDDNSFNNNNTNSNDSFSKMSTNFQKYVLQRMILPLKQDVNLMQLKADTTTYEVWTMNYASNNEKIEMRRTNNYVQVKFESSIGTISSTTVAYRCFGAEKYKDDRSRDLTIYPVDFLLVTKLDQSETRASVCAGPPCKTAQFVSFNNLIVILVTLLSVTMTRLLSN